MPFISNYRNKHLDNMCKALGVNPDVVTELRLIDSWDGPAMFELRGYLPIDFALKLTQIEEASK